MALTRPDLDYGSPEPLYVQAADHVATLIAKGRLKPGTKFPAERDLADDWQIAYGTVRRMMQLLRDRGLIISRQGKGTYVSRLPD